MFNWFKKRIPAEVAGAHFGEGMKAAFTRPELDKMRSFLQIPDAITGFETEYAILVLYMHVCACDSIFGNNPEYARQFLDALHKKVFLSIADSDDFPDIETFQRLLHTRYATYSASAKRGLDKFYTSVAGDIQCFLSEQNPHWQVNMKCHDAPWGCWPAAPSSFLSLKLWVGETLKELIDRLAGLKRDYKLGT